MANHWTRNLPEVGDSITGDRAEFAPRGTSRFAEELDAEIAATKAKLAELRKQRRMCEKTIMDKAFRGRTPSEVNAAWKLRAGS